MKFSQCFSVFTIFGALTLSVPAWADVPPEDACSASNVGEACPNALIPMPQGTGNGAGVCQAAMCTRGTPDGTITYKCYRCVAPDDGAGGQSNEAGGAAANGGGANNTSGSAAAGTPSSGSGGASTGGIATAGSSSSAGTAANAAGTQNSSSAGAPASATGTKSSSTPKPASDDGGCSLSHAPSGGGALWGALVALGLTFAGIRRRRSLTS